MTDNLSPSAPPETDDIPTSTTKTVDLTPEQREALFGDQPPASGDTVTVTLKAGDVLENGGAQTFEVVPNAAPEGEPDGDEAPADESSSDDEKKALGYDRGALTGRRKKQSAKVDMDALGRD